MRRCHKLTSSYHLHRDLPEGYCIMYRQLTQPSSRSTQRNGGRSWLIGLTSRSHRAASLATAPAGDVSSRTSAFWSLVDESEVYTKNWVGVWQSHPYVVLDHLKTPLAIGFFFGGVLVWGADREANAPWQHDVGTHVLNLKIFRHSMA